MKKLSAFTRLLQKADQEISEALNLIKNLIRLPNLRLDPVSIHKQRSYSLKSQTTRNNDDDFFEERWQSQLREEDLIKRNRRLSDRDSLIRELLSFQGYLKRLRPIWNRCLKEQKALIIIHVDGIGLKAVNESPGGREAGNRYIKTIARVLKSIFRRRKRSDLICRLNKGTGDEFICSMLAEYSNTEANREFTQNVAALIQKTIAMYPPIEGYQPGLHIGAVVVIPRNKDFTAALMMAEDNCNHAKKTGEVVVTVLD